MRKDITTKYQYGFTLIELLIVIAIIGLVLAFSIFGLQGTFEKSRDTQRKSDLKQYQTSFESYANKNNGLYPSTQGSSVLTTNGNIATTLGVTNPPQDPKTPTEDYRYQSNGSAPNWTPTATQYVLWAKLEDVPTGTTSYWVVCSNGKSSSTSSGIPPTLGACPI